MPSTVVDDRPHGRAALARRLWTAGVVLAVAACSTGDLPGASPTPDTGSTSPSMQQLAGASFSIEQVFAGVELESPTFLAEVPDGSHRLVVLQQSGSITEIKNSPEEPAEQARTFLDIRDRVNRGASEEGLLGLAFHPGYAANGRFFVYYSAANPRRSVLSEFESDAGGQADAASERVILEIPEPFSNHNGGMLVFGPDGYLYVGVGDGGAAGDPMGNGQNPSTLLGSILRIDVDHGSPYGIPESNPFVDGQTGRAEVWAYGFRNPWRFSFDPGDGRLWVADVGQNEYEEVSVAQAGGNFGWNVMEGPFCYAVSSCDRDGFATPLAWYDHSDGCSITGGYVNRDGATPALNGHFIVADYCSGRIWAVDETSEHGLFEILHTTLSVTSFGEAQSGVMYVLSASDPGIYRIVQH